MGRFVVIEGLDGAGTTTQVALLARALAPRGEIVTTREPTDRAIGRVIRSILRGEEGAPSAESLPWLFAADRADHLARTIAPGVARGAIVISDRYYHSSLAYQSGAAGVDEIWSLNRTFRAPDLTVLVEVPVAVALRRIAARGGTREIFEHERKLAQVAEGYRRVAARLRAAGQRIETVDGDRPPEIVADDIARLV